MTAAISAAYPIDARNRIRRRPNRAVYDRAAVHAILDAGLLCHVGYVIDGQPFVTPSAYWRHGERIYWHGSAASRMIERAVGNPVCVTVSFVDGLVLARSQFHHSIDYRSVMLFGRPTLVEDPAEKTAAMDAFLARLYPGRVDTVRPATERELKTISVAAMTIDQASAKVRAAGVIDEEEDYALPVWAGTIPVSTRIESAVPDARLLVEPRPPVDTARYVAGARLDDVLRDLAAMAGRDLK